MFCANCGKEMEADTRFCPECGAVNEAFSAETVHQNQIPTETPAAPAQGNSTSKGAPLEAIKGFVNKVLAEPKKLLIPGIAAAAVVVILIVVLSLGGSKGPAYGSALDNYFDTFWLYDASKSTYEAMAPEGYWEWREDYYGKDVKDYYEEYRDRAEDYKDSFEDKFGKNIKVSYEVTKEKELSEKKLGYIAEYLEEKYDIDEDLLTAGYQLDIEYTIKGSEDEFDGEREDVFILKIDGKWYVADVYLNGDDTTVSFSYR